ncbi:MAG: 50S ribosome-binding GTPase, partial [Alphaproteobacteria bacterium]|nr:50S ribosome-binding GTPase [Alphaproteobacteria bacterium]
MNNFIIIGKVNEGKSHLFNLFSKDHKTISNPKENTTVDIIRKLIQHHNYSYYLYDTPGFYTLKEFNLLLKRIDHLGLSKICFIYLSKIFTDEDLKICKLLFKKKYPILFFSFNNNFKNNLVSNLFEKSFIDSADNLSNLKRYLIDQCPSNEDVNINNLQKDTVAIFGKENTGKSTLFNKITDISLSQTSPSLHTTRDSVNWDVKYKGQIISFFNTAGFIR